MVRSTVKEPEWLAVTQFLIILIGLLVLPAIAGLRKRLKAFWAKRRARRRHERIKRAWGRPGRIGRFLENFGKPYDPRK
ncbi:MAG TPA: hypothetical protein VFK97_01465 [Candidatus Saccharimonadales bacterium]|nr:hypothetical protein [Candidatus Saccharimonadales bacterium]